MANPRRNIQMAEMEKLDWGPSGVLDSLARAGAHALAYATASALWYQEHSGTNRSLARWLRFLAIVLVAAAGILPMIQQLTVTKDGSFPVPPVWASVLLALAVFLVALDRFFGFSTGWIRYVQAEAQIRRIAQAFELDWQKLLASYGGQPPSAGQVQQALAAIRAFVDQVNDVIGEETQRWIGEFQEALRQLDDQVKSRSTALQDGSITVTVANGDVVDPPGWTLTLDLGQSRLCTGKTAALAPVLPGDHTLHVQARAGGKPLRAEAVASVKAGVATALVVTLA